MIKVIKRKRDPTNFGVITEDNDLFDTGIGIIRQDDQTIGHTRNSELMGPVENTGEFIVTDGNQNQIHQQQIEQVYGGPEDISHRDEAENLKKIKGFDLNLQNSSTRGRREKIEPIDQIITEDLGQSLRNASHKRKKKIILTNEIDNIRYQSAQ